MNPVVFSLEVAVNVMVIFIMLGAELCFVHHAVRSFIAVGSPRWCFVIRFCVNMPGLKCQDCDLLESAILI